VKQAAGNQACLGSNSTVMRYDFVALKRRKPLESPSDFTERHKDYRLRNCARPRDAGKVSEAMDFLSAQVDRVGDIAQLVGFAFAGEDHDDAILSPNDRVGLTRLAGEVVAVVHSLNALDAHVAWHDNEAQVAPRI